MSIASRIQLTVSAIFAFAAVLLGALGAHALEENLLERGTDSAWDTAALYHITHSLALFAVAIWGSAQRLPKPASWAFGCFVAGIICFSGSIYILSLGGPKVLGPVTPIGGLFFL